MANHALSLTISNHAESVPSARHYRLRNRDWKQDHVRQWSQYIFSVTLHNVRNYNFFVNNGRQSSAFLVVLLTYTCTVLTKTYFAGCAFACTCLCYSSYHCLYSEIEATNACTTAPRLSFRNRSKGGAKRLFFITRGGEKAVRS